MAMPDSVAQALMGEIDAQLNKLTELAAAVVEATRAVNEAKLVTLDQHTASMQKFAGQLVQLTNQHAERLTALTNKQVASIEEAEAYAAERVTAYANKMRSVVINEVGTEIAGVVNVKFKAIDDLVFQLAPALTQYTAGVKQLVADLESHAHVLDDAVAQAARNGVNGAVQMVGTKVDGQIDRLYKNLFLFLGGFGLFSAVMGAVVSAVVSHWLK